MKGERLLRNRIARETRCTEWCSVDEKCVHGPECGCLHEARAQILKHGIAGKLSSSDTPETTSDSGIKPDEPQNSSNN